VYKRRWTALAVLTLVVAAAAIHALAVTPIYEARAQLLIEDEKQNVIIFKDAVETANPSTEYYQTQYKILQSRTLAQKTLDELKLWDHPEFTTRPQSLVGSVRRALVDPVRTALHRVGIGSAPTQPGKATQAQRVQAFVSRLTIAPVKSSRLVDVLFRAADPSLAANAANTLARVYIKENRDAKFAASKEASDWLSSQLGEQRERVQESEVELQRYRERNDALSVEDRQNIVVQKLSDLNAAATKAKTDRIQKEGLYKQLASMRSDPAGLASFPLILANPIVQQLRTELAQLRTQQAQLGDNLGNRHPEMVKLQTAIQNVESKIGAEVAMIVESLRSDFVTAQELERSLTAALDAQKAEALALNRKEIDYGVLERDATTNRQIFQSLLQRARETGITGEMRTNNIRVVDQAQVPRTPVWPRKNVNLFFALCGGSVLAVGLTFFLDYVDGRIKTPDEIKGRLDLPFLGLVPKVRSKTHVRNPLLNNGVPAGFAEAFRAIRTNVLFSSAMKSGSVVITSTGPSEGKTVVAANLSLALAMTGQRVLLIDADMRRPKVHQVFALPQMPGLSELMVGEARASEAIRPSGESGLWLLPAGTAPHNPAELLSSNRFKQFLAALSEHYDWVIIDSPPVMAVTDAAVLAHTASAVLFVVAAEVTHRANALAALEQLEAANATFVGAVLNGVDLERNGFLYSDYYRREYGAYYQGVPQV
jgi:capsular exopolysaccharide synthesis family protein